MTIHMDDYKTQYEYELKYQEINSNNRTLMGFVWFLLTLTFIWFLTMIRFFDVDETMVTTAYVATILLFLPALYIKLKGDLSRPWLKYLLLTLICIVSAVIISILSFHAVFLHVIPLLFAIQYRHKGALWYVYVLNTIALLISSLLSFYYGLCDLNLLFQSQHVRSFYLEQLTMNTWQVPLNTNPCFVIIVYAVFPRSIILFVFTIMMQYTVISSGKDALRIAQLTYLKEMDSKTKVYNKNKYQEMIFDYYPKIENVAVLFWDLNDLKKINDVHGHAMGDMAIEKLSAALHVHSSDRCRVYRVGGDEFLMILDNPKPGEAENIIFLTQNQLKANTGSHQIKVTSAVGLAYGSGKDLSQIVQSADANMYIDKRKSKELLHS